MPAQYNTPETNATSGVSANNAVTGIFAPTLAFAQQFSAVVSIITSQSVSSGSSLFSVSPTITLENNYNSTGGAGTADLNFTVANYVWGTATISVTLSIPSRATLTESKQILVNFVNQQPSFACLNTVTRLEDAGTVSIPSFATSVSAGPGGEGILDSQTVASA